jgi:hypothetical protein
LSSSVKERAVGAIRRFWARSLFNKVALLLHFSLVFCCCGWTGRIGEQPAQPAGAPHPVEISESPAHRSAGW